LKALQISAGEANHGSPHQKSASLDRRASGHKSSNETNGGEWSDGEAGFEGELSRPQALRKGGGGGGDANGGSKRSSLSASGAVSLSKANSFNGNDSFGVVVKGGNFGRGVGNVSYCQFLLTIWQDFFSIRTFFGFV
jgi:hypothetical protein